LSSLNDYRWRAHRRAVRSLLEDDGRSLGEERRRFRDARRTVTDNEDCFGRNRCVEELQRPRRTGGQRRERIAQTGGIGPLPVVMAVGEVDEAAAAVGVF
jgi:hypothetical protein